MVTGCVAAVFLLKKLLSMPDELFGLLQFLLVLVYLGYVSKKELADAYARSKPAIQALWTSTFQKSPR